MTPMPSFTITFCFVVFSTYIIFCRWKDSELLILLQVVTAHFIMKIISFNLIFNIALPRPLLVPLWEISSEKLSNFDFSVFLCAGPAASQSDHCRDSWDTSLVNTIPATLFIRIGGYIDLKIVRHGIRSRIFIYELLSVYCNCVNLLM